MSQPTFNKDQFQAALTRQWQRFTVGSRNDVAPVVAGSEWGVG